MFVKWYAVLYAASLLLGCTLLAITWRHRDRPGVGYALLFIGATAIWMLSDLLNVVLETWWLKRTGGLLAYTGAVFVSPGWFCYVLVYTGNEEWLTRRALAGLFGFGVLVTAAF